MKKLMMTILMATIISVGFTNMASAEEQQNAVGEKKVELTAEQLAEVKAIHQNILEQKKKLVSKYVEYGQISKEDGDKLVSRFDQKFKKMEEMGFQMPKHHPFHKDGKHE